MKAIYMTYQKDCHYFNGYKPCKFKRPCEGCPHYQAPSKRIALISLEALGAVLRSTCLLKPIKRKFPNAHITFITSKGATPLLQENQYIDRLIKYDEKALAILNFLKFDILYSVDKSLEAGALAQSINSNEKHGFGISDTGAIIPLSKFGNYQYDVGLDDDLKFYKNQKTETEQITNSMNLEWQRDPYVIDFNNSEKIEIEKRTEELSRNAKGVLGFSTGCSLLYPYKKFTVERSIEVVSMWRKNFPDYNIALFGGPEDSDRNKAIYAPFIKDNRVINTPTNQGLRSGIMWMDTADIILSGCSLGLHITIALQKKVIAWFGVSCHQEIDLYDKGVKLLTEVNCSPCWKKSCDQEIKCFNEIKIENIHKATTKLIHS